MKRLSMRAAQRCETAKTPRCKCRCGGALHGAARNMIEEGRQGDPKFFENLPRDDPHHAKAKRLSKPRVLKRDRVPPLFEEVYGDNR